MSAIPALRDRLRRVAVVGVLACITALVQSAQASDLRTLLDRLERLERDIRTLNIQINREQRLPSGKGPMLSDVIGPLSNSGLSRVTERLDGLEQDIRGATGSLEQVSHTTARLADRLDKLIGDVDFRLSALEEKLRDRVVNSIEGNGLPSNQVQSSEFTYNKDTDASVLPGERLVAEPVEGQKILGTVAATSVKSDLESPTLSSVGAASAGTKNVMQQNSTQILLPAGKPREQYTFALNLLRQTKYDQAEIALTQFITSQSDHPLAGNARYWLGETYYVRADFEQAAQTFFSSYRASPENIKAPDMLLKLGMSLFQMKKLKEACATFDKLTNEYEGASMRIKNAVSREKKRARC